MTLSWEKKLILVEIFWVVEPWQRINKHKCSPTESLASFPGFARRTWDRGYGLPSLCSIPSFPGSHAHEREHWSCAGVESLVFFLTWEVVKDRREVDATLIVCGCMRLRTEKGTKVAGNLLHVSSYRASNIIHTERWSIVGWTTRKMLPFCFCPILITSCLRRKDTRLSTRYIFTFRESLGTRLWITFSVQHTASSID